LLPGKAGHFVSQANLVADRFAGPRVFFGKDSHQDGSIGRATVIITDGNRAVTSLPAVRFGWREDFSK
jgi:hypothetical protein